MAGAAVAFAPDFAALPDGRLRSGLVASPPPDFQAPIGGERRRGADRRERDEDNVRLQAAVPLRPDRTAARAQAAELVLADHEARVVLVHVELAVEPEHVGVVAQEALDVRLGRQQVELLLLEGAQVLAADLRPPLDFAEVQLLAQARLAKAVADLEHSARSVDAKGRSYSDAFSTA